MNVLDKALLVSVVANGLLAGLFFTFACAVGAALGRLDDQSYVAAFRSINSAILNGWFLSVFFLAPVTAGIAALRAVLGHQPTSWAMVAGAVCSLLTFIITVTVNVPLNEALEAATTTTASQYSQARQAFEGAWNQANLVRTLTSVAACTLIALASAR